MKSVGESLPSFEVQGVKPKFNEPEENGQSAFETITEASFPGKWKIIYFYPKDFSGLCPTEIIEFARLNDEFERRGGVVMGGSTDNEFCKLVWRKENPALTSLNHYAFADTNGSLLDGLGLREAVHGVALRGTVIIDPQHVIQHITVNPLLIGRNPEETLRVFDALVNLAKTGEPALCNRPLKS